MTPSMNDVRMLCSMWGVPQMADEIRQLDDGRLHCPLRKLTEREAFAMLRIWAVLYDPDFRAAHHINTDHSDESVAAHFVRTLTRGTALPVA